MELTNRIDQSVKKAKLTLEQVIQIKKLIQLSQLTDSQIASIYEVSTQHINRIRNGKRWGNLDDLFQDDICIRLTNGTYPDVLKFILDNQDKYHFEEIIIRGKRQKK
jgi:hypothetical protein